MWMPNEVPASKDRLAYRAYYDRLKTQEYLYRLIPNPELKKDLEKSKKIIDKYKNML